MVGARSILPAQFTRMSTFPRFSIVFARRISREARSHTSQVARRVWRDSDSISRAVASTCSTRREEATTSAPAAAKPRASTRPIPDVPPITTAVLPERPAREGVISFLIHLVLCFVFEIHFLIG